MQNKWRKTNYEVMVNETFAALYEEKYFELKKYFLKNFNGNAELADDLAQECYFRLLKHTSIYGDKDINKYYLFKIAQNVKFDHIKRKAGIYNDDIMDVVIACNIDFPLMCDMEIALDGLTSSEKILLTFMREGLKSHEIATIMKITPSAVRARIGKLRKTLKKYFDPHFGLKKK